MNKLLQNNIRNFAIIAHVDHGKTSLVDQMFQESGLFRDNQTVQERLMDSMDQEKERGITIMAKNGGLKYQDYWFNIIDTPGHADFGGQVECVLKMADAVLLLVDASEGPMPQTYFVLKKALNLDLPVIVVINKIDKPSARPDWVVDQVFDLMIKLDAPDHITDFPVVYASARDGYAMLEHQQKGSDMTPLFETIVKHVPHPKGDKTKPLKMLVSLLKFNQFVGRLAVGKLEQGSLAINQDIVVTRDAENCKPARISKIYKFVGNEMEAMDKASAGDVIAVAGVEDITLGETITNKDNPQVVYAPEIDPPTISMNFLPNDSPFAGQEGEFVNVRQLKDRLEKETLTDVAVHVEVLPDQPGYKVSGRGELHLSVLVEKLRREGYELQVTMPRVIFHEKEGKKLEPYEELTIDLSEESMGAVIERLGQRKGSMLDMRQENGLVRLTYKIPTRGFLGFRSEFMTLTKGMGTISSNFLDYELFVGEIEKRENGVLIAMEAGTSTPFALFNLQSRGIMILGAPENIYEGQIVGIHSRRNDLVVNACKGKKLTNMRASGSDDSTVLIPHKQMSLEDCLTFISEEELVEVTPKAIRLRKVFLTENERKRAGKKV
ncbi:MAG: translational GTPase TypA [bacterium]|nr:translational GTPase TypA [bacterium]